MHNLLQEIVRNTKAGLLRKQREKSIARLFAAAGDARAPRPFAAALRREQQVAVIAEIKKASPTAGTLREDFDPVEIAKGYRDGGAQAISVLTEESFFKGDLKFLTGVSRAVDLPLLRKDFIVDPYQVVEARAHGADAVLLILGLLSRGQCAELAAAARECRLDCLVEVHTIKELELALSEDVPLVGINNRDLTTFEVDLATAEKLLPIVPPGAVAVSESGLKSRGDLERVARAGADAVLIGETLMRAENVSGALAEFAGVPKWSR